VATRLEAIRNSLSARGGNATDAKAIAAATESAWRDVTAQLSPVIGSGGLEVLFGRALHQAASAFPWLAGAGHDPGAKVAPATLTALLASHDAASAREASAAVLMNFAELLASLIGEHLARRLLAPVWALRPPATDWRAHDER
jgi:hypothetical protein